MIDAILLFPYWLALKLRNARFNRPGKAKKAEIPTICLGNITAGGTGKTPHTEMILKMLQGSDEWGASGIAVLSRGYKRGSRGFQQVPRDGSAALFGDEPLQIKKKFPGVTVAVDKNRIEGCDFLAHPEKLQGKKGRRCIDKDMLPSDIVVLDDAYQYRKLAADMNIVLVDYNRPLHKDHLLPIGRLRDLPQRVHDADIVIVTKCPYVLDNWEKTAFSYTLGYKDYQASTCVATTKDGRKQLLFFTQIIYGQIQPIYESTDSRYIYSKRMVLFTGIAKDLPLRNYLSDSYKIGQRFSFPDHHKFTSSDIRRIRRAVEANPTAAVATTEKDAQRVLDYKAMPEVLMERMFQIPITVDFLTPEEREIFRAKLLSVGRKATADQSCKSLPRL